MTKLNLQPFGPRTLDCGLRTVNHVGFAVERFAPVVPYQRACLLTLCLSVADRARVRVRLESRTSAGRGGQRSTAVGDAVICWHAEPATCLSHRAGAWLSLRVAVVP